MQKDLDTPRRLLCASDAQVYVGIGRTAYREHVMPFVRTVKIGRRRLVSVEELDRFIAERSRDGLA